MKKAEGKTTYFFVDEAGDPVFYDKRGRFIVGEEGCSKILMLGFICTDRPEPLRKAILSLKEEIKKDKYLEKIPSIHKTLNAFHAKDDCPEVREKVFKLILKLDFKAEFIVARKIEAIFKKRHQSKMGIFYNDLFSKLFENKIHGNKQNIIYYAVRGNRDRQSVVSEAVQTAILSFEERWKVKIDSEVIVQPQSPMGEPCLQIIDYMSWALQRAFVKEKISFLVDIYDTDKYPKNFYNRRNKFDVKKISPL